MKLLEDLKARIAVAHAVLEDNDALRKAVQAKVEQFFADYPEAARTEWSTEVATMYYCEQMEEGKGKR